MRNQRDSHLARGIVHIHMYIQRLIKIHEPPRECHSVAVAAAISFNGYKCYLELRVYNQINNLLSRVNFEWSERNELLLYCYKTC